MGSGVVAWVRLGDGVGALVAAKMLDKYWMASMVWAPKRIKGADGTGLARASTRRLAASVAALVEDIAGMAPLWGNSNILAVRSPRVSGT